VIERCGCYRLPVGHDLPLCKMRPARALRFVKMSYVSSYARTTAAGQQRSSPLRWATTDLPLNSDIDHLIKNRANRSGNSRCAG
jgi:hypothetical protein